MEINFKTRLYIFFGRYCVTEKESEESFFDGEIIFSGEIGKSLTLILKSSYNKPRVHCAYRRPLDYDFSGIGDDEWKENFKSIGADNNSCSFVIKNFTDELIGNWELVTSYKIEQKNKPIRLEKKVTNFLIYGWI